MNNSDFLARIAATAKMVEIGVLSRYEGEKIINEARAKIGLLPLAHLSMPYGGVSEHEGVSECPSCNAKLVVELLGDPDEAGSYMVSCLCPLCGLQLETYTPRKLLPNDPSLGNLFKRIP